MLEKLNAVNNIEVISVFDRRFKSYGNIIEKYNFSSLINYIKEDTQIPTEGNIYIPSVEDMEKLSISRQLKKNFYGGMDIQIGYCNGKNSSYNGFEYHKSSEINVAVTDFMLVLGHVWEISNNEYTVEKAKVFYVPKGIAIEMFQTTLHLSPCKVRDEGFMDIVVLQKGTNTISKEKKIVTNTEDELLLLTNKWVLAHKDRKPLIKIGAYPGLIGENIELKYK